MKKQLIILLVLIPMLCSAQEWKLHFEEKSMFMENLGGFFDGWEAFAVGNRTNSMYAEHIIHIDTWDDESDRIGYKGMYAARGIVVKNHRNAWVCGYRGLIAYTNGRADLDAFWNLQESGVKSNLWSIDFGDTLRGIAVGEQGCVLLTEDGGLHWKQIDIGTKNPLRRVFFADLYTVYILDLRVDNFTGTVYKSTDGGHNWNKLQYKANLSGLFANSMFFTDANNGWIVGNRGFITHTSDGGKSWITQQEWASDKQDLNDAYFLSNKEGYVVGDKGVVMYTSNGGNNWTYLDIDNNVDFKAVLFTTPHLGFIVSDFKVYMKWDEDKHMKYVLATRKNIKEAPKKSESKYPSTSASAGVVVTKPKQESKPIQNKPASNSFAAANMQLVGLEHVNGQKVEYKTDKLPIKFHSNATRKYADANGISNGITQMMEQGYLPVAMSLRDQKFVFEFAKSDYIGTGWQLVESELDHAAVSNDITPYLQEAYIPFAISIFAGKYYTLLVQLESFPATNWALRGYDKSQTRAMNEGIAAEINQGFIPFGYLEEENLVNILFLKF